MATPGQNTKFSTQVNIQPVFIENREALLRQARAFESRLGGSNVDIDGKFSEIISLCSSQGNPASAHLEAFMLAQSRGGDKGAQSGQIHGELMRLFRGVLNESNAQASENASLVSQVNQLVEVVKQYQDWQSNVYWQLDQSKSSAAHLESLSRRIRDYENAEAGWRRQCEEARNSYAAESQKSLRIQAEFDAYKRNAGQADARIRILEGENATMLKRIQEFSTQDIELNQLRSMKREFGSLQQMNANLNVQLAELEKYKIEHFNLIKERELEKQRRIAKAEETLRSNGSNNKKLNEFIAKGGAGNVSANYGESANLNLNNNPNVSRTEWTPGTNQGGGQRF